MGITRERPGVQHRLALLLSAAVALFGCAGTPPVPVPVISPTGKVYPIGIPPVETRYSQAAALFLEQGTYARALEQTGEGLISDAESGEINPLHFLLAGLSHAGLGRYDSATVMWERAMEIYPAYELEVEPARETAWAEAFNAGADAYNRGEVDSTIVIWQRAVDVYDLRPDVHRNLAALLVEDGRYEQAIAVFRAGLAGIERMPASWILTDADHATREEARNAMERDLAQLYLHTGDYELAEPLIRRRLVAEPDDLPLLMGLGSILTGRGDVAEAQGHFRSLLDRSDLGQDDILTIGVSLFGLEDFAGAAEAFRRMTLLQPFGRDVWFNYANALLAMEDWDALIAIGPMLTEADPLGENAALILAQAHLAREDEGGAIEHFERTLHAPVHVDNLRREPLGAETIVRGVVRGNEAAAGSALIFRFLFYSGEELIGSEDLGVTAPERGASEEFELHFRRSADAYRYSLVEEVESVPGTGSDLPVEGAAP